MANDTDTDYNLDDDVDDNEDEDEDVNEDVDENVDNITELEEHNDLFTKLLGTKQLSDTSDADSTFSGDRYYDSGPLYPSSIGFHHLKRFFNYRRSSNVKIPIFKRGFITGLTSGFLHSLNAAEKLENGSLLDCCVVVHWAYTHTEIPSAESGISITYDKDIFSKGGDSGSLYYMEWHHDDKFQGFVPISIHLAGENGRSVGCRINEAFRVLGAKIGKNLKFCDETCCTPHPVQKNKINKVLYYSVLPRREDM